MGSGGERANNQWAISAPYAVQSRVPVAQRAQGFGFRGVRVDGNDVLATHAATQAALASARGGDGPTLIEAVTYRRNPHTTSDAELPGSIVSVGGRDRDRVRLRLSAFGVGATVIELLDRPLPSEDPEISKEIARAYRKLDVTILTSTRGTSVADDGEHVTVTYVGQDGAEQTIEVYRLLVSVGFAPNVEGIGLDAAGVALTDRGAIAIDETNPRGSARREREP